MTQTALSRINEPTAPMALAPKQNALAPIDLRELKQLAEIMVASGAFSDIKQVAQAQVKIMAGAELGFTPMQSMTGIHFFQGKVEFSSTLKASLIKSSGKYDYEVVEHTNQACAVQFYRVSGAFREPLGPPVRYTIEDAREAGLAGKDVWKKHPADMLFAACIRQGTRRHCADVLRGVSSDTDVDDATFTPEEIVQIGTDLVDTATGEVLEDAAPAEAIGNGHPEQPLEQSIASAEPQAPTGDSPAASLFASEGVNPAVTNVSDDTPDSQLVEWIASLGKLKFGSDQAAFDAFLKGRNPAVMPRAALIKLHGELAAL